MIESISNVRSQFDSEIAAISSLKDLESFRVKFLARNGSLAALYDTMKSLPNSEKPAVGKLLNEFKLHAQAAFDSVKLNIENGIASVSERIDLSLPGRRSPYGTAHPVTQTLEDIKSIFKSMGFAVAEGPELESDYNNFEALNFPPDHPARDMQDTFFVNTNFLLRTHTTPVQVRLLNSQAPPVRAIMPGRVFRNEAISARSYCMFHQVDGIYVDKNVTFAELKGTLVSFAYRFYGSSLKYRFRPSFFPFTEPSAEMDITCYICGGKGCRVCKHSGWLEILGCGMVDPNVMDKLGIDNEKYVGYAFGMGIERIALLKYNISDIRVFFDNDVRFLKQF